LYHSYRLINPNGTVPTLIAEEADGSKTTITQSLAALEYLEEAFPYTRSLLPSVSNPARRAKVRELVSVIATDVQPPANLRIQTRVSSLGGDPRLWAQEIIGRGFDVYEKLVEESAGKYSVGDEVTMADVVLVAAVEGALAQGIDPTKWKTVNRIWKAASELDEFKMGHWSRQGDTPDELRMA